jgi:hypothetical protein
MFLFSRKHIGMPKVTSLQTIDISAPTKHAGLSINTFNLQGITTFVKASVNTSCSHRETLVLDAYAALLWPLGDH